MQSRPGRSPLAIGRRVLHCRVHEKLLRYGRLEYHGLHVRACLKKMRRPPENRVAAYVSERNRLVNYAKPSSSRRRSQQQLWGSRRALPNLSLRQLIVAEVVSNSSSDSNSSNNSNNNSNQFRPARRRLKGCIKFPRVSFSPLHVMLHQCL